MIKQKLQSYLYSVIFAAMLGGCAVQPSAILTPKYLAQKDIFFEASEVIVKTNKDQHNISPELSRMLGVEPADLIEQWVEAKFQASGTGPKVVVSFPKLNVREKGETQYDASMKVLLSFESDGRLLKNINVSVSGVKGFHARTTYSERKDMLYALLQDLIASAHENIMFEMFGKGGK